MNPKERSGFPGGYFKQTLHIFGRVGLMRPRTRIEIPNPSHSEFENFDRAVKILLTKRKPDAEKPKKPQATKRRLPRP